MEKLDNFREGLIKSFQDFSSALSTENGDWAVKGFIDVSKNIYTISADSKVISKIIELMIFPVLESFAQENKYKMIFASEQNHYPDLTFETEEGKKIALDLKSTYRKANGDVSGFTLGAFTGYFRDRESGKNITFPYSQYEKHYILGIIYTKQNSLIDERRIYTVNNLEDILSVARDFDFVVQEKYKIAKDRPGSGNTKNIGSCVKISKLKAGEGPFASYNIKVFDDYWMNYMTKDMAIKGGLKKPPYTNINEYLSYRNVNNI